MQQRLLIGMVLAALLGGCAQPQIEQPRANGSYLLIENGQAWAVLVADGKRVEERGTVLDAIRLPGEQAPVAASYVIETPNCGRVQWLSERRDAADGLTSRMSLYQSPRLEQPGCALNAGLSRVWTVLDYSG